MANVYARVREDGVVMHLFSDMFEKPKETDFLLKSGEGEEYIHVFCEGGVNLYTYDNLLQYKIENGEMIKRSSEELERERVILLKKQLEQEKEKNYQTVTTVLRETVCNPNLIINPNFSINQRDGYIVKEGATVYFDTELTQVANANVPSGYPVEEIHKDYATLRTKKAPIESILYAKIEDIEKGYAIDTSDFWERLYTVDRWFLRGHGSIQVEEDGIVFTKLVEAGEGFALLGTTLDEVSDLEGKALTLTAKVNGTMSFGSIEEGWAFDDTEYTLLYLYDLGMNGTISLLKTEDNQIEIRVYFANMLPKGTTCKLEFLKLEFGKIATKFEPPEQVTELVKCKYYYQEIETISNVHLVTKDKMIAFVPYVPMRTVPSLSFKTNYFNTYNDGVCITDATTGDRIEGFTFKLYHSTNIDSISVNAEKANHGLNKTTCFFMAGRRNKICLSAENK